MALEDKVAATLVQFSGHLFWPKQVVRSEAGILLFSNSDLALGWSFQR
jgi:hypothetical protein